jgi:hypothetical protein
MRMRDNVDWMNYEYNRHRMARRPKGQPLTFGPRLGWRRKLCKRRYAVKEPDVALGECPFGGHHAVGQAMLTDPWVQEAVRIMSARAPKEPEEPAKPARKRTKKTQE